MNIKPLLCTSLILVMPLFAYAGTIIVEGMPGDNTFLPATNASPNFPGGVIDFSNLSNQITANCTDNLVCPTFNSSSYASQGVTISSPDGLLIYPFSTQTAGGIELYDEGTGGDFDGTANINISLAGGVNNLAVGISDSDSPVTLTITALGQNNTILAMLDVSTDIENAASSTGNTYFVAEDTVPGIYGLEITQTTVTNGSGLALAEVEFSPEPSTFLLLLGGSAAIFGFRRFRGKA